ncbi:MAG TPA: hypothetical protein VKX40_03920 [Aequorivita sp.]|nr:hypothetical protein [Aequorivita sp.]
MFKKLLPLLLVFILFSCKKNEDALHKTTWIGGQIVNPKLDYVIFSRGGDILDTVKLDSNSFFLYRTDKITKGLYTLRHNETQVFFIEPGDSLLLHLNTMDFDESLAYSGRGAEQNNLLMYLFLTNETENRLLPQWYTLSPDNFTKKIDSLKAIKVSEFDDFLKKNKVSSEFKKVAQASIDYDHYSKKELYTAANMSHRANIGDKFYDYRKKIDFGNNDYWYYYPYYRFLNRYFDNLIAENLKSSLARTSFDFSLKKIKAIDSLVKHDSIRNSLIRFTALRCLYNTKNAENGEQFFEAFSKVNNNSTHVREIEELVQTTLKMSPGNPLPNVLLINMDNTAINMPNVIDRPTVFYFWTTSFPEQVKTQHNRAAELKSKYPEYDFIGINTDSHFRKWRSTVIKLGYNPLKEFQLENMSEAEKILVLSWRSKAIIVDKDKTILDGNTNMFNANFEELLLGYLNR